MIYAPLSQRQRQLYQHVVDGGLRQFLINRANSQDRKDAQKDEAHLPRALRSQKPGRKRKSYVSYDESDDEFRRKAEAGDLDVKKDDFRNIEEIGKDHEQKAICGWPRPLTRSYVCLTTFTHSWQ